MKTKTENILIYSTPEKVFAQMDDFFKTVMYISESSLYLPLKQWYYKILSFFFANWYFNWCFNNMLNYTKINIENKISAQATGGVQL